MCDGSDADWHPAGLDAVRRWAHGEVDAGRLPGIVVLLARGGRVGLSEAYGMAADAIVRIYSMTKPITAAAALAVAEDGLLALDDPVARHLPAFAGMTVNRHGAGDRIEPVLARRALTVRHLLMHTAGMTYGDAGAGAIAGRYVADRVDFGRDDGALADVVDRLARIPLLYEPGTSWSYGVATDVLGRVLEVATGAPLDEVLERRILAPLGMRDTGFVVPEPALPRLVALHEATADGGLALLEPAADPDAARMPSTLSGGAGLYSTAADYLRFCEMLRRGGTLDGHRVLTATSVRAMLGNGLPGDLAAFGVPTYAESPTDGVGFGLGVSVVVDPARTAWRCGAGEAAWGGYASTAFWIDPEHDVTAILLTQVIPSDRYPLRRDLRALVMDALA